MNRRVPRSKRLLALAAIGALPFTMTACPADDDGEAETEDVIPGDEEGDTGDTDEQDG